MADEYAKVLDTIANSIKNKVIRECLLVSSRSKLYPRDCITNGSLEQMMREILALEEAAGK